MTDPLVSIIIPMYNAQKYVTQTIQSAIDQTWGNKEIIIINNGSTDNSLSIAEGFKSHLIRIFSQDNKGASSARNYGLREAKGEYIQFLDADDLLMPDKIELQVKQLAGQPDIVSACPVIHFNAGQTNLNNLKPSNYELAFYNDSNNPYEFLLNLYGANNNIGSMVPVHSWLTPAALINKAGSWDERLTINDDGEFFCRVILQSKAIKVVLQTVCYYRKHGGNLSLSAGKDLKSVESEYQSTMLRLQHLKKQNSTDDRVNVVMSRSLMELLMHCYPRYKALSNKIIADIQKMGGTSYVPIMGGKLIELVKRVLGWKAARIIQYYLLGWFKKQRKLAHD